MAFDYLAFGITVLEVVAAVLVIFTAVVFLYAIFDLRRKARTGVGHGPTAAPAAKLTLSEQLRKPRPRPYCFVNGEEVRSLYTRTLHRPVPRSTTTQSQTQQAVGVEAGPPIVKGSASRATTEGTTVDLGPPSDEELLEDLMRVMVEGGMVGFGIEAARPDQEKIDAVDEGLRKLAIAGADAFVDSKKIQEHRKALQAIPAASPEEKRKEIDAIRRKYSYVAMKGRFECGNSSEPTPSGSTGTPVKLPVNCVRMKVPGVDVVAELPLEKVKPGMVSVFQLGQSLDDLMLFATIIDWRDTPNPKLTLAPLAVALNWSET
jgi:hypothetical protein